MVSMMGFTPLELVNYGRRLERAGKNFDARKPLKLAKRERCCQLYCNGDPDHPEVRFNQTRSYLLAGYKTKGARQNASRFFQRDDVRLRCEYLMAAKVPEMTKETVTAGLWQTLADSKIRGRPSVGFRVLREMAIMHGLMKR